MSLAVKLDFVVELLLDLQEQLRSKRVSRFNLSRSRKEEIEQAKKVIADKLRDRAIHPSSVTVDNIAAACGLLEVEAKEIHSYLQESMLI
jgi:hypothetical protein